MRLALYAVLTMLAHAYDARTQRWRSRARGEVSSAAGSPMRRRRPPSRCPTTRRSSSSSRAAAAGPAGPASTRTAAPRDTTAADEAQAARAGAERRPRRSADGAGARVAARRGLRRRTEATPRRTRARSSCRCSKIARRRVGPVLGSSPSPRPTASTCWSGRRRGPQAEEGREAEGPRRRRREAARRRGAVAKSTPAPKANAGAAGGLIAKHRICLTQGPGVPFGGRRVARPSNRLLGPDWAGHAVSGG